jgi:hypothetical protein
MSVAHGCALCLLSAPLLRGRVLELYREGRGYRLAVVQMDGKDRRQVGGFDLTPAEWPHFAALVPALGAYVAGETRRPAGARYEP